MHYYWLTLGFTVGLMIGFCVTSVFAINSYNKGYKDAKRGL